MRKALTLRTLSPVILRVHRACNLSPKVVMRLWPLTNSPARGDVLDDGTTGGSTLTHEINMAAITGRFPKENWVILAFERARLVGWCMLGLDADNDSNDVVFCADVYVDPCVRRRGVGARLLKRACRVAASKGAAAVASYPWNRSSDNFFRSCGFELKRRYFGSYSGRSVKSVL